MRLKISKSRHTTSLYVLKSTYINGKHSSKIVEKLGTCAELKEKLNGEDPIVWAKKHIAQLNQKAKEGRQEVLLKCSPAKLIPKDEQRTFNGGYLFLQKIYYQLGLHRLCQKLSAKYNFNFDLDSILSRLLYARIIFPASKLATLQLSKRFIEQPNFELQHIYRALDIIAEETDFIQSSLYNNSRKLSKRNTNVLYYDCTNYYFEIEQEAGLKRYGFSKEHRPNPIVQMGLFMDGDGIPLAFSINQGNTNEQVTLLPLEKKIMRDFNLSKFIVCTDAGLSSQKNRNFNNKGERAFITTQSIKQLKEHLMDWALNPKGWKLFNGGETYDITELKAQKDQNKVFYKERWINENGLEQRLLVTYSLKYRDYQRHIRDSQLKRAKKTIDSNPGKLKKYNQNDYKRLIKKAACTNEGEIAENEQYSINTKLVAKEEMFDGFYAVCTNLEDKLPAIIKVIKGRWEIEECFRIMKSELKARPVYLSRDNRIKAHFITCFLSLILYRYLEKKLGEKYTCSEIIHGLRDMYFFKIKGEGYIPAYTRTDFTDSLHEAFGFRTDLQIVTNREMKKIITSTKS